MTEEIQEHLVAKSGTRDLMTQEPLFMVGIASSAGGLEALTALVSNLPKEAKATYILAQHMSPSHKSLLSSLISRETQLQVTEISEDIPLEPGTIYVPPPNSDVIVEKGLLKLRAPSGMPAIPKPSADRLFESIAKESGDHAVGIILSGTGSDGSYGTRAIREAGGITIAQAPDTAKYNGMPVAALQTGLIDVELSPSEIGKQFQKILERKAEILPVLQENPNRSEFHELITILYARTNNNFADYKKNTLNRRIARRMSLNDFRDLPSYIDHCRSNVDEVDALNRDLLISVTRFFRDPDQFRDLKRHLKTTLSKNPQAPIRAWVAGCATGEEAYTIAIIITEVLGGLSALSNRTVQIFATDVDEDALQTAKAGIYPLAASQDIPRKYLSAYFIGAENELRVHPEIRNCILFSRHNVIQDPPFINLDLVTIRNVLIYFNSALQERVLTRLHYSMAHDALLFLGTSETVGDSRVFFEARDKTDKIYGKRRGVAGDIEPPHLMTVHGTNSDQFRARTPKRAAAEDADNSAMSLAQAVAPNGFICTRNGEIIEVLGNISAFSEIRAGMSTALTVKLLISPLRTEASSLIAVALRSKEKRAGRWHDISVPTGNQVRLVAYPFNRSTDGEPHCLLAIDTRFEDKPRIPLDEISDQNQRAYMEQMEEEIRITQEALQQTIEELQTTNEELQSANEELQSTNEEFQATNEELETSNEELQSTNEELLTVNEELQINAAERQALTLELEATLAASPHAVTFADPSLIVRRMSRSALELFGLESLPASGLHLSHCKLPPGFPALSTLASAVLRARDVRRIPVLVNSHYYSLTLSPVSDHQDKMIGVSITVTKFVSEPLSNIATMVGRIASVGYWVHTKDCQETQFSEQCYEALGYDYNKDLLTFENFLSSIHPADKPEFERRLSSLRKDGEPFEYETRFFDKHGSIIIAAGSITAIEELDGEPDQLVGVFWDKAEQAKREMLLDGMKSIQEHLQIGVFTFDTENNEPSWNQALYDLLELTEDETIPSVEVILDHVTPDDRPRLEKRFEDLVCEGVAFKERCQLITQNGPARGAIIFCNARTNAQGKVSHVFGGIEVIPHVAE